MLEVTANEVKIGPARHLLPVKIDPKASFFLFCLFVGLFRVPHSPNAVPEITKKWIVEFISLRSSMQPVESWYIFWLQLVSAGSSDG